MGSSNVLTVIKEMCDKKILVTVKDLKKSYIQSQPVLTTRDPVIPKQIIQFNQKYLMITKRTDQQEYLIICKMLHEVGNLLSSGILSRSPNLPNNASSNTPTNNLAVTNTINGFGAAVEEMTYGGRVRTADKSAQPFRNPLKLVMKEYSELPHGPGNCTVYQVDDVYITAKMAALRAYSQRYDAVFPGLWIPPEHRAVVVAKCVADTAAKAAQRQLGTKAKRSDVSRSSDKGCNDGDEGDEGEATSESDEEDEDEHDPDFAFLVANGMAFSAAQVTRMKQGYRF